MLLWSNSKLLSKAYDNIHNNVLSKARAATSRKWFLPSWMVLKEHLTSDSQFITSMVYRIINMTFFWYGASHPSWAAMLGIRQLRVLLDDKLYVTSQHSTLNIRASLKIWDEQHGATTGLRNNNNTRAKSVLGTNWHKSIINYVICYKYCS